MNINDSTKIKTDEIAIKIIMINHILTHISRAIADFICCLRHDSFSNLDSAKL